MIFTENKTHCVLCTKGVNLNWILWISVLSHNTKTRCVEVHGICVNIFIMKSWKIELYTQKLMFLFSLN